MERAYDRLCSSSLTKQTCPWVTALPFPYFVDRARNGPPMVMNRTTTSMRTTGAYNDGPTSALTLRLQARPVHFAATHQGSVARPC